MDTWRTTYTAHGETCMGCKNAALNAQGLAEYAGDKVRTFPRDAVPGPAWHQATVSRLKTR